jgi:hypothetical protein
VIEREKAPQFAAGPAVSPSFSAIAASNARGLPEPLAPVGELGGLSPAAPSRPASRPSCRGAIPGPSAPGNSQATCAASARRPACHRASRPCGRAIARPARRTAGRRTS